MNEPDLKAALGEMAAETLAAGKHLTADELVAYRGGQLSQDEKERVQEHLAACPDCTSLLLDLAVFQEEAGPSASEFEVAAVWRGVRQRAAESKERVVPRPPRSPRWLQALAASLLVATAALSFRAVTLERRLAEASRPEINTPVEDLRAPVARGAAPAPVTVTLEPGMRLFTLVLVPASRQDYPDYEVTLLRAGGSEVWTGRGFRKNRFGSFSLTLSRGLAGSGEYLVRLSGLEGDRRISLGEYDLRINSHG